MSTALLALLLLAWLLVLVRSAQGLERLLSRVESCDREARADGGRAIGITNQNKGRRPRGIPTRTV